MTAADLRAIARAAVDGAPESWVVGGAVRDELLGRPVLDLDVACREPEAAARRAARATGGAPFPLSERHGGWRVVLDDGRTLDFTPLAEGGLLADLAVRDFTVNAIASPLAGGPGGSPAAGEPVDPHGGILDLAAGLLRAVTPGALDADPLRLLRAVRLEDELGLRLSPATEAAVAARAALVTRPAGERVLAELVRLSPAGWQRLAGLGLLAALGGDPAGLARLPGDLPAPGPDILLAAGLGRALLRLPVSNEQRRRAKAVLAAEPPADPADLRALHRFRRATEPWTLDALALRGHGPASPLACAVLAARAADPAEPLLRGDELGLPPGPAIGRLLALVEEERAAGAVATREDALALARAALAHDLAAPDADPKDAP